LFKDGLFNAIISGCQAQLSLSHGKSILDVLGYC